MAGGHGKRREICYVMRLLGMTMKREKPGGLNPEQVFGILLGRGFESRQELARALREFAHIQECEWARQMLVGFQAK